MSRIYAHMCRDQHTEIGHNDSGDDERCPLCQALDALEQITQVCLDNADNSISKSQQGMALNFVMDVAAKTACTLTQHQRGSENV